MITHSWCRCSCCRRQVSIETVAASCKIVLTSHDFHAGLEQHVDLFETFISRHGGNNGCLPTVIENSTIPVCALHRPSLQDFNNPFDLFESFFGGRMGGMGGMGGAQRGPTRVQGDDERYDLTLNFLEAVFGTEKKIDVSRLEECGTCNGSGAKPGTTPQRCPQCNGQGQVRDDASFHSISFHCICCSLVLVYAAQ